MTDQPAAVVAHCEHHYETRILGGHPLSVRICLFCRTPDWADLREQADQVRDAARQAVAQQASCTCTTTEVCAHCLSHDTRLYAALAARQAAGQTPTTEQDATLWELEQRQRPNTPPSRPKPAPAACGLAHYSTDGITCTEPSGHDGPHAGPYIVDGKQVGGAAWDVPAVEQPAGAQPADLRERIASLFRHPPGTERLGDATPGEIADAVLAVLKERQAAIVAECDAMEQAMTNGHASLSRLREHITRLRRMAVEETR